MRPPARPITPTYLQNAATAYLEHYPTTAEGLRRILDRRVRNASAEGHGIGMIDDPEKLREARNVDKQPGRSNAQVHQREQRLPASDHPRLDGSVGQDVDSLCQAARSYVVDGRGFHRSFIFAIGELQHPTAALSIGK